MLETEYGEVSWERMIRAVEKVRQRLLRATLALEQAGSFRILALEALVRMKLTSFRDRDRMHLRDLLEVGLIDAGWKKRFPPELENRLKQLVDDSHG